MLLLAGKYPQFTVEHEECLVVTVMDMDRAGVAAPGEVVSHGEGPAGLFAAEAHLGQGAQPALSRQIRDLERALGVSLFDRTSRRVVLSQAGQAVLGRARRALTESDRAVRLARLAARGDWGELAISAPPAVALALLPAILRATGTPTRRSGSGSAKASTTSSWRR